MRPLTITLFRKRVMLMEMSQCTVGTAVKIHPGHDAFMQGFRYGTITKVGRKWVTVEGAVIRGTDVVPVVRQFPAAYLLVAE